MSAWGKAVTLVLVALILTLALLIPAITNAQTISSFISPDINGIYYSQATSVSGDWPMFGSDPSHSGVGTGNPVLTPTLLWNYNAPKILDPKTPLNPFSNETQLY